MNAHFLEKVNFLDFAGTPVLKRHHGEHTGTTWRTQRYYLENTCRVPAV